MFQFICTCTRNKKDSVYAKALVNMNYWDTTYPQGRYVLLSPVRLGGAMCDPIFAPGSLFLNFTRANFG